MQFYLIKILGIILVTMCCFVATCTDVKRQIIPNKLTFTTIAIGILLVSFYFFLKNDFNLWKYFISILVIYLISYILWRLGLWAGGDVKLLTAISTLLIPDFLDILPKFNIFGILFPFGTFPMGIPTLLVMFNSVVSVIPLVLVYVMIIILKNKRYLIRELAYSFNFKEVFLSLNSLAFSYSIISIINVSHVFMKIIFMITISFILFKVMKNDYILLLFTIMIIFQQLLIGNILFYITELILISVLFLIKNIYKKGIIKEVLTNKIPVFDLKEGMILQHPLYYKNDRYYFDKTSWYDFKDNKGKLICSNSAGGLTDKEVLLLKEIFDNSIISIKKSISFAPFVLVGLFITIIFGNTYQLFTFMLEMIV